MEVLRQTVELWSWTFTSTPHGAVYVGLWLGGGLLWLAGTLVLARGEGFPLGTTALVLVSLILLTLVGARAHAVILEQGVPVGDVLRRPLRLLEPGWRLPGGLALALLAMPFLATVLAVRFAVLADTVTPCVGLAIAAGRLGCLCSGCCTGTVSSLPWALSFPPGTETFTNHSLRGLIPPGAESSLPVHPLPVYLALGGLMVSALLLRQHRRRAFGGETALLALVVYGMLMGGMEFLREVEGVRAVPFRQALPLSVAALGGCLWLWQRGRPEGRGEAHVRPGTFSHPTEKGRTTR